MNWIMEKYIIAYALHWHNGLIFQSGLGGCLVLVNQAVGLILGIILV